MCCSSNDGSEGPPRGDNQVRKSPCGKVLRHHGDRYQVHGLVRRELHVKFLRFIQLHVEDLEKTHQEGRASTRPKAKASPKPRASSRPIDLESENSEPEDWDQVQEEHAQELLQMQRRMTDMENVMHQVLAHLKGGSTQ